MSQSKINMTEDFQSESARLIALRLIDSTYKAIGKKTKRKDAEITELNCKKYTNWH